MSRLFQYCFKIVTKFYPVLFLCLILCNFVLSCSVYRAYQPRHYYHTVTNSVWFYSTVTQYLATASVSSNLVDNVSSRGVDTFCNDYVYFLVDGRPRVRLWGRPYFLGSRTSRGIIVGIFPDRVQLDNGNSIIKDNHDSRTNRDSTDSAILD